MLTRAHLINSLHVGGAEKMLLKLLDQSRHQGRPERVLMIHRGGPLEKEAALSAELFSWWKLTALQDTSELVCWMYHSCLVGILLKILRPRTRLVWNIRHSLHDLRHEKAKTRWVIRLLGGFAFMADEVIYNSQIARLQHQGFFGQRPSRVIPNGFDPQVFHPASAAEKASIRRDHSWPQQAFLWGLVARFHPMKGHRILLEALASLPAGAHLVCIGLNTTDESFTQMVRATGTEGRVWRMEIREDIPVLLRALDGFVLASQWGEGFPNVVGEAMLTGLPCVVTDVGDAALVLGDETWVVEPQNVLALGEAMLRLMALAPKSLDEIGQKNRARVERLFSLPAIWRAYQKGVSACAGS